MFSVHLCYFKKVAAINIILKNWKNKSMIDCSISVTGPEKIAKYSTAYLVLSQNVFKYSILNVFLGMKSEKSRF